MCENRLWQHVLQACLSKWQTTIKSNSTSGSSQTWDIRVILQSGASLISQWLMGSGLKLTRQQHWCQIAAACPVSLGYFSFTHLKPDCKSLSGCISHTRGDGHNLSFNLKHGHATKLIKNGAPRTPQGVGDYCTTMQCNNWDDIPHGGNIIRTCTYSGAVCEQFRGFNPDLEITHIIWAQHQTPHTHAQKYTNTWSLPLRSQIFYS